MVGGGAAHQTLHQHPAVHREVQRLGQVRPDPQAVDAQPAPPYLSEADQVVDHELHRVDRDGKTDSHAAARGREDHTVDTNHLSLRVQQRPAGIAAVDGGVGLDGFVQQTALLVFERTLQRADDAGGQGALEAEGVADGQHFLADLQAAGIPQWERGQASRARINSQHRQVGQRVEPHNFCFKAAAVGQCHLDLAGVRHHVVVGDDVAALVDQEA